MTQYKVKVMAQKPYYIQWQDDIRKWVGVHERNADVMVLSIAVVAVEMLTDRGHTCEMVEIKGGN